LPTKQERCGHFSNTAEEKQRQERDRNHWVVIRGCFLGRTSARHTQEKTDWRRQEKGPERRDDLLLTTSQRAV
jgi:hypothetical protein